MSRALGVGPVLDIPLEPEEPGENQGEGEAPTEPHSTEPPPSLPPSPGPDDDEEDKPPTEPA